MFAKVIIHVFYKRFFQKFPKYVYFTFYPEILITLALSIPFFIRGVFQIFAPLFCYAVWCHFEIRKYTKDSFQQIMIFQVKISAIVIPILFLIGSILVHTTRPSTFGL